MNEEKEIVKIFQEMLAEQEEQTDLLKKLEKIQKDIEEQKDRISTINTILLIFFIFYILIPLFFGILSFFVGISFFQFFTK